MPEAIKTQEFLESILSLAASSGVSEENISATDFGIKNRLEGCVREYVYHMVLKPLKINNVDFDLSNSDFSGLELDSLHSKPATTTTKDFLQRILSVASGSSEDKIPEVKDQVNLAVSQYIRHLLETVTQQDVDLDLSSEDFSNLKLDNLNLQNAKLKNTKLRGSDLSDTNFQGAELDRTVLRGAQLGSADFTNAELDKVDVQGGDFPEGTDLRGTIGLTSGRIPHDGYRGTDLNSLVADHKTLFPSDVLSALQTVIFDDEKVEKILKGHPNSGMVTVPVGDAPLTIEVYRDSFQEWLDSVKNQCTHQCSVVSEKSESITPGN
jgi:uncharacterized protein YjbI with pentapeptide repeats